jgi:hypothetical protein
MNILDQVDADLGQQSGISILDQVDQDLSAPPKEGLLGRAAHSLGVAAKSTGELGGGALMFVPSWLGRLGYTGIKESQKALAGTSFGDQKIDVNMNPEIGRQLVEIAEAKQRLQKLPKSAIREEAERVQEGLSMIVPQSSDPIVRHQMEKVGEGFHKIFGWADEINAIGRERFDSPFAGDAVQFLSELAAFGALHKVGKKARTKVAALRKKAKRGDDLDAALDKALDDLGIGVKKEDLSTPEKRQAAIEALDPELFDNYRASEAKAQGKIDAQRAKAGFMSEEEVRKIRARQKVVADARARYQRMRAAKPPTPEVLPAKEDPPVSVISGQPKTRERAPDTRRNLEGIQPVDHTTPEAEIIKTRARESTRQAPPVPPQPRGQAAMENLERIKREQGIGLREGDKAANKTNEVYPDHPIRFDDIWDPGAGYPKRYQFTVTEGPHKGKTFNSKTLATEDIRASLEGLAGIDLKPKESKPVPVEEPAETPSVQNVNKAEEPPPIATELKVLEVKPEQKTATPIDLDRLPDWVEIELESIYKDPNSPKRIGEIARQLLETGELDKPGLVKTFKSGIQMR